MSKNVVGLVQLYNLNLCCPDGSVPKIKFPTVLLSKKYSKPSHVFFQVLQHTGPHLLDGKTVSL